MTRWRFRLLLLVLIGILITVFFIQPSHGARKYQPPSYANYKKTVLTVGYLTAIHGEGKEKQGLAVSGAITLALSEVNKSFTNRARAPVIYACARVKHVTEIRWRASERMNGRLLSLSMPCFSFRLTMIHICYQM